MKEQIDPVLRTKDAYHKEKLNCAQSVLKGFQPVFDVPDERISEAKAHGGGRCGALHSALSLVEDAKTKERLVRAFVEAAGSEACREIRRQGRLNCAGCVELAARLLAGK